ncbi:MAG: FecR domain-containing protein [Candidatus Omnitrophica bacterium]|nr:FecR domain-containing protein [Candidatus Omnitrophota bacterium]
MKTLKSAMIALLVLGMALPAFAERTSRTATIKDMSGTVEVKARQGSWAPASVGMVLNQGDTIRTKAGASAVLSMDGKEESATVSMKESSQLALAQLFGDKKKGTQTTLLDLALGEVLIKTKKLHSEKSKFEVKTPTSIIGVRGTTFSIAVEAVE